jgi:3-dehydrosphinganine reductase
MDFSGKCVYISGGASGIGLAIGCALAARGANVLSFSVDDETVRQAAEQQLREAARGDAQTFRAIHLDVTDHLAVERELNAAAESFGAPFGVVNSAGIGGAIFFEELTYERFDATIKVSLYGARNVVAACLPHLKQTGGFIVNVASMSGLIPILGYTAYGTAKAAMVAFSESLRSELKQYDIHVSALCPGQVDTPLWRSANEYKPPEVAALNKNSGTMKPEQIAAAVIEGIEKRQRLILPGFGAKALYLLQRICPCLREALSDRIVRRVQADLAAGRISRRQPPPQA